MTDDMLVKLAPKFGVQLPPELQKLVSTSSSSGSSGAGGSSSKGAAAGSGRRATVVFPGDFKMAPAGST
jgi:hypothetical protein